MRARAGPVSRTTGEGAGPGGAGSIIPVWLLFSIAEITHT